LFNVRHIIEKLYEADDTFKDVYEDYLKCLKAFDFWVQSDSDEAAARRIEYAELIAELEEELMQILNEGNFEKEIG
jgi:hypothetical protein